MSILLPQTSMVSPPPSVKHSKRWNCHLLFTKNWKTNFREKLHAVVINVIINVTINSRVVLMILFRRNENLSTCIFVTFTRVRQNLEGEDSNRALSPGCALLTRLIRLFFLWISPKLWLRYFYNFGPLPLGQQSTSSKNKTFFMKLFTSWTKVIGSFRLFLLK